MNEIKGRRRRNDCTRYCISPRRNWSEERTPVSSTGFKRKRACDPALMEREGKSRKKQSSSREEAVRAKKKSYVQF